MAASSDYAFRLRSDRDGVLTVSSDGVECVRGVAVKAGEMFSVSLTLKAETTPVNYTLALADGEKVSGQLQVTRKRWRTRRRSTPRRREARKTTAAGVSA